MPLRQTIADALKSAMLARQPARVSTLRMIQARLKDTDIAARPKGISAVPDTEIVAMLRGMAKSRAEAVTLYRRGGRPELAEKEEAEIALIESFLPAGPAEAEILAAIETAIPETGAASVKDAGRVMGALKARFEGALDMARAGATVRGRLGGA